MKNSFWCVFVVSLLLLGSGLANAEPMTPLQRLGLNLYFDENLSSPTGQSCASCHDPSFGFVDPDFELPVSEGAMTGEFGGRNSPAAAYAMYAPVRYFYEPEQLYIGGQFWDSRATGYVTGDPLADQALGPFLNPVEMHNYSETQVIAAVKSSTYADLFEDIWGPRILNNKKTAYEAIALSIAAFERSALFGQFSSKYDAYLAACVASGGDKDNCAQGTGAIAESVSVGILTDTEWNGLQLFMDSEKGNCVACHVADWIDPATLVDPSGNVLPVQVPFWSPDGTVPPVFTDFTYDNLGVPKSEHPLLADAEVDLGLGAVVGDPDENGKFKVMTLRNIALTPPYAHNGYFETLEEITNFYNTRDLPSANWPAPEYPATVNDNELGDLGLTPAEEAAIVAFMMTLSDGYRP